MKITFKQFSELTHIQNDTDVEDRLDEIFGSFFSKSKKAEIERLQKAIKDVKKKKAWDDAAKKAMGTTSSDKDTRSDVKAGKARSDEFAWHQQHSNERAKSGSQ